MCRSLNRSSARACIPRHSAIVALGLTLFSSCLPGAQELPLLDSFPGTINQGGGGVPDSMGAAGPNHIMVTINGVVLIQDRHGGVVSRVSSDTFWSSLGVASAIDPRLYYDPFGQRWLFSSAANQYATNSVLLLAVSASSDPTGPWYRYLIPADPTQTSWADFPKLGFNSRWVVVQANMEPVSGTAGTEAGTSHLFIFNKTNLYAGGSASPTYISVPPDAFEAFDIVPAATYDANLQSLFLLALRPDTRGPWTDFPPLIRIYELTGPVGAETLLFRTNAVAPLTWPIGRGSAAGLQAGTVQTIRILEKSLDNVIYRNGTLWTVHNIFPSDSTDQTDIQWWQLATNGQVLQFGRIEDPTGTNRYGFPSIAVNKFNDVFIGYNLFSPLAYISARYAFHGRGDAAGVVRADGLIKAGEAPFAVGDTNVSDVLHWGDYSQTVVDPVNDTDFWTLQEYPVTPVDANFNYGVWWGRFVPPGAWPVFIAQERSNSDFRLTFTTSAGNTYNLQSATNLSGAPWQTLQTNLAGTGSVMQATVTNAFATPQAFFRLRITP